MAEDFPFGFNVKPSFKAKKPKATGAKKARRRGRTSSKKSKAYWSGQFGS